MNCPFCQNLFSYEEKWFYCHNQKCLSTYCINSEIREQYETDIYGIHIMVDVNNKKNIYTIFIKTDDVTDSLKEYFDISELKLRSKTTEEVSYIINKLSKISKMKVFW